MWGGGVVVYCIPYSSLLYISTWKFTKLKLMLIVYWRSPIAQLLRFNIKYIFMGKKLTFLYCVSLICEEEITHKNIYFWKDCLHTYFGYISKKYYSVINRIIVSYNMIKNINTKGSLMYINAFLRFEFEIKFVYISTFTVNYCHGFHSKVISGLWHILYYKKVPTSAHGYNEEIPRNKNHSARWLEVIRC